MEKIQMSKVAFTTYYNGVIAQDTNLLTVIKNNLVKDGIIDQNESIRCNGFTLSASTQVIIKLNDKSKLMTQQIGDTHVLQCSGSFADIGTEITELTFLNGTTINSFNCYYEVL